MEHYLKQHGGVLVDNGYQIVPIKPGTKYPELKAWQKVDAREELPKWLSNGHAESGIGILTKWNPAIDIDCRDQEVVDEILDHIELTLGGAPIRIGDAPKTLLLYRTDEPFRKVASKRYRSPDGAEHQLEILGDGQQFVAYAIHPGTGQPYHWTTETAPHNLPADELPTLSLEQARELVLWFDDNVPFDWIEVGHGTQGAKATEANSNSLDNFKPQMDLTYEQCERTLAYLDPNDFDYDQWIGAGMAIWHQFDGGPEGLDLWNQWSSRSDKYQSGYGDAKWRSFASHTYGGEPRTFASLYKLAKGARLEQLLDTGPFKFLTPHDLEATPPPIEWIVEDVLESDTLGVGFGVPGSLKSFWALDLAMHIAAGKDWHGKAVKQGTVAYIAGEGRAGLRRRIHAWRAHHNEEMPPLYLSEGAANLLDEESLDEVVAALKVIKPTFAVVDTLARNFGGGDENSTTDMNLFVNLVSKRIKEDLGITVLIIHHTSKSNPNAARGSGALKGAVDCEYQIEKPQPKRMHVICRKMKDAEDDWDMWFRMEEVSFATSFADVDKPGMTSLVPVKTTAPVQEMEPLKGSAKAIYDHLKEVQSIDRVDLARWAADNEVCTYRNAVSVIDSKLVDLGYAENYDGRINDLSTEKEMTHDGPF